ncbi:MAG TPA: hypothetical protein VGA05_02125 [Candidatus Bathyarchaeia archaeon]
MSDRTYYGVYDKGLAKPPHGRPGRASLWGYIAVSIILGGADVESD